MKISQIITTCVLLTIFSLSTFCQTEKGKVMFSGSSHLNFSFSESNMKSDDDNEFGGRDFEIELLPQVGFFVADNFAIGFGLPLSYAFSKDSYSKSNSITAGLTPFAKYYFGSSIAKPFITGGFGVGLINAHFESDYGTSDDIKANFFMGQLGGGLAVFINEKTALEIGLIYGYTRVKQTSDNPDNERTINSGVAGSIGFSIVL